MDRRVFLEGLCASVVAAGLKSPGEAEAHALVSEFHRRPQFRNRRRRRITSADSITPPRVRRSPGSGAYGLIRRTQESAKSGSTRAMDLRIGFCCRAQPTSTTSDKETTRLHRNI